MLELLKTLPAGILCTCYKVILQLMGGRSTKTHLEMLTINYATELYVRMWLCTNRFYFYFLLLARLMGQYCFARWRL